MAAIVAARHRVFSVSVSAAKPVLWIAVLPATTIARTGHAVFTAVGLTNCVTAFDAGDREAIAGAGDAIFAYVTDSIVVTAGHAAAVGRLITVRVGTRLGPGLTGTAAAQLIAIAEQPIVAIDRIEALHAATDLLIAGPLPARRFPYQATFVKVACFGPIAKHPVVTMIVIWQRRALAISQVATVYSTAHTIIAIGVCQTLHAEIRFFVTQAVFTWDAGPILAS
jgi:hypothetical protein